MNSHFEQVSNEEKIFHTQIFPLNKKRKKVNLVSFYNHALLQKKSLHNNKIFRKKKHTTKTTTFFLKWLSVGQIIHQTKTIDNVEKWDEGRAKKEVSKSKHFNEKHFNFYCCDVNEGKSKFSFYFFDERLQMSFRCTKKNKIASIFSGKQVVFNEHHKSSINWIWINERKK